MKKIFLIFFGARDNGAKGSGLRASLCGTPEERGVGRHGDTESRVGLARKSKIFFSLCGMFSNKIH